MKQYHHDCVALYSNVVVNSVLYVPCDRASCSNCLELELKLFRVNLVYLGTGADLSSCNYNKHLFIYQ
jgi:hypothetical protein